MLSILEVVIKIIIMIIILLVAMHFLVKEIKEMLKFYIFTWNQIFNKNNHENIKRKFNLMKTNVKKFKRILRMRKEQKKHRAMWNEELEQSYEKKYLNNPE